MPAALEGDSKNREEEPRSITLVEVRMDRSVVVASLPHNLTG